MLAAWGDLACSKTLDLGTKQVGLSRRESVDLKFPKIESGFFSQGSFEHRVDSLQQGGRLATGYFERQFAVRVLPLPTRTHDESETLRKVNRDQALEELTQAFRASAKRRNRR